MADGSSTQTEAPAPSLSNPTLQKPLRRLLGAGVVAKRSSPPSAASQSTRLLIVEAARIRDEIAAAKAAGQRLPKQEKEHQRLAAAVLAATAALIREEVMRLDRVDDFARDYCGISVGRDELIAAGQLGVLEALARYDAGKARGGWSGYFILRIRFAIQQLVGRYSADDGDSDESGKPQKRRHGHRARLHVPLESLERGGDDVEDCCVEDLAAATTR